MVWCGVVWCGSLPKVLGLMSDFGPGLGPGPEVRLSTFCQFNMVRVCCGVVYCGVVRVPPEGPGPEVRLWAWAWAWARGQTFNSLSIDKFILSIDKMVWVCYGVVWCGVGPY